MLSVGTYIGHVRFDDLIKVALGRVLHSPLLPTLKLISNLRGRYLEAHVNILLFIKLHPLLLNSINDFYLHLYVYINYNYTVKSLLSYSIIYSFIYLILC